jgi:hypothetical protein
MKTFKQHVKEGHKQEKYGAGQVGTTTSNSPCRFNIRKRIY